MYNEKEGGSRLEFRGKGGSHLRDNVTVLGRDGELLEKEVIYILDVKVSYSAHREDGSDSANRQSELVFALTHKIMLFVLCTS